MHTIRCRHHIPLVRFRRHRTLSPWRFPVRSTRPVCWTCRRVWKYPAPAAVASAPPCCEFDRSPLPGRWHGSRPSTARRLDQARQEHSLTEPPRHWIQTCRREEPRGVSVGAVSPRRHRRRHCYPPSCHHATVHWWTVRRCSWSYLAYRPRPGSALRYGPLLPDAPARSREPTGTYTHSQWNKVRWTKMNRTVAICTLFKRNWTDGPNQVII